MAATTTARPPAAPGPSTAADDDALIDETVQQLAAFLGGQEGVVSDDASADIFARLSEDLRAIYAAEAEAETATIAVNDRDALDSGYSDADSPRGRGGPGQSGEDGDDLSPSVRDYMPRRPLPIELWRAAHEKDEYKEADKKMTSRQWSAMVDRLNDSSKRQQAYLLRAQHKQIADELDGMTFKPEISERSRQLAAHNRALPERTAALMRRRKAKLDRVRHERAQAELAEATFKPQINPMSRLYAEASNRKVAHLMQYEVEKRLRAAQRRQILQESQDRELTFTPSINPNSSRIVKRITEQRSRKAAEAAQALAAGDREAAAAAAAESMGKTTQRAIQREQAAVAAAIISAMEKDVKEGRMKRIPLGPAGLTILPGHEEETFTPSVNPRSAAWRARGTKGVYNRLWEGAKQSANKRMLNDAKARAVAAKRIATGQRTSGVPTSGPPLAPADHVNIVAYDEKYDFVVRRVLAVAEQQADGMQEL